MKRKRIFPLTALLLLFAILASSCGGGKTPAEATTATELTTATTVETTTAASTEPSPDFGGYEFKLRGTRYFGDDLWYTDAKNISSVMENRLAQRYRELEDKLNINITWVNLTNEEIVAAAAANKSLADLHCLTYRQMLTLAIGDVLLPLNTDRVRLAGLDVDDHEQVDYYATQLSKQLDGENVWAVAFSGEYFSNGWGKGIVFNKRLLATVGYPADTMYQLVRDGKWTWTKFEEICHAVANTTWDTSLDSYCKDYLTHYFADIATFTPLVSRNNDGKWRSNVDTPEFRSAVEFFDSLLVEENDVGVWIGSGTYDARDYFNTGHLAMFLGGSRDFGYARSKVNVLSEDDYGFIPMPKVSEDSQYVSVYEPFGFSVEKTNPDVDRTVYILSELGEILNDPSYEAINIRGYMRDDESVEMIMEYVRPNSILPPLDELFGVTRYLFDNLQSFYADLDTAKSLDEIISTYHPQLQAALDELFGQ